MVFEGQRAGIASQNTSRVNLSVFVVPLMERGGREFAIKATSFGCLPLCGSIPQGTLLVVGIGLPLVVNSGKERTDLAC